MTDFIQTPSVTDANGIVLVKYIPGQGVVVSDGTNDRVLVGFQQNGFGTGVDYGFKVSQSGYDVATAVDSQMVMSTAFNMFKIVDKIILSYPAYTYSAGQFNVTASHDYGYTPVYFGFSKMNFVNGAVNYENVIPLGYNSGANDFQINSTEYTFVWRTTGDPGLPDDDLVDIAVTVYIMQETAA